MYKGSKGISKNICSVALCRNAGYKVDESGHKFNFFSFPKDPKIQQKWIKRCYRKDPINATNARICNKHFKPEDFEDQIKARVLGYQPKQLKKTAIPSLLLRPSEATSLELTKRRRAKRKRILEDCISESSEDEVDQDEEMSKLIPEITIDIPSEANDTPENKSPIEPHIILMPIDEFKSIKTKFDACESQVQRLKNEVFRLNLEIKKRDACFETKAKELFKNFLTPNQVEILLQKKTRAKWTKEEYSRALALYFINKRSYMYVTKKLKYPFPGLSSLQRWAANPTSVPVKTEENKEEEESKEEEEEEGNKEEEETKEEEEEEAGIKEEVEEYLEEEEEENIEEEKENTEAEEENNEEEEVEVMEGMFSI